MFKSDPLMLPEGTTALHVHQNMSVWCVRENEPQVNTGIKCRIGAVDKYQLGQWLEEKGLMCFNIDLKSTPIHIDLAPNLVVHKPLTIHTTALPGNRGFQWLIYAPDPVEYPYHYAIVSDKAARGLAFGAEGYAGRPSDPRHIAELEVTCHPADATKTIAQWLMQQGYGICGIAEGKTSHPWGYVVVKNPHYTVEV